MANPLLISPSILSADLGKLAAEIADVEAGGADYIHVDVMDGHFVPNITWGAPIVAAAKKATRLPIDVHLMISEPDRYVESFAEAGADLIGIHIEADFHAQRTLSRIRALGKKSCITLNPQTPVETIEYVLDDVDQVLLMSVNPGFGGQKFLPLVIDKIARLRARIEQRGLKVDIEVDGGISEQTARSVVEAGANVLVAGAAVFGHPDRKARIAAIRAAALSGRTGG
ncbi:MAG TPA: ribulose-phosphate 3-epimerase [Polyangiaceae bacterium]|nr:ribulose-phosphate 3-epimerase [Polyangiaceae bacterium]